MNLRLHVQASLFPRFGRSWGTGRGESSKRCGRCSVRPVLGATSRMWTGARSSLCSRASRISLRTRPCVHTYRGLKEASDHVGSGRVLLRPRSQFYDRFPRRHWSSRPSCPTTTRP
jgi:hypothetical protein